MTNDSHWSLAICHLSFVKQSMDTTHVVWHRHSVSREDREKLNETRPVARPVVRGPGSAQWAGEPEDRANEHHQVWRTQQCVDAPLDAEDGVPEHVGRTAHHEEC